MANRNDYDAYCWLDGMGFELGQRVTGGEAAPQPNRAECPYCHTQQIAIPMYGLGEMAHVVVDEELEMHSCIPGSPWHSPSTSKTPSQKRVEKWVCIALAWAALIGFCWLVVQTDADMRQSGNTYWQDKGGKR